MPDEPSTTATDDSLEAIDARMASFEERVRRLSRSIGGAADAGQGMAQRPGSRRLGDAGLPRSEDGSGLRPAVEMRGPKTGALTARIGHDNSAVPGFTSAFGKPAVVLVPSSPSSAKRPAGRRQPIWLRWQWHVILGLGLLGMLLVTLPRRFPVLPDAGVWAEAVTVQTAHSGQTELVPVRVGDAVGFGQSLARIDGLNVVSPIDGVVARLLVSVGTRLKVGEPVAEVAVPASRRIVVALPGNLSPSIGDLVRIELLGDGRTIDGNIEQVLLAGVTGPWIGPGASPRRAIIQPAPSPLPISLRQGARVTIIGSTPLKRLGFAVRDLLPW